MSFLKNKTILITGGTGSFGKAFVKHILENFSPNSIRILSRDELKQWEMKKEFSSIKGSKKLRFFLGDIRDKERLKRAFERVDVVVHAAAMKQVPASEYNPMEAIKTNIIGSMNVIDACLDNNVKKIIALSTDKASLPINLYGATKLCADKLFVHANNYSGNYKSCRFSVVRYGNVMGSRGSVIPTFLKQKKTGVLTLTDEEMTRFWITLKDAVEFVIKCLKMMQGGELFIPKIPSMRMLDLAEAIAPKAQLEILGLRSGEKLHESLVSKDESLYTYDLGDCYMLEPHNLGTWDDNHKKYKKKPVSLDFSYSSDKNTNQLSVKEMRKMIKKVMGKEK